MIFNRKDNKQPSEKELSNWQIIDTPNENSSKITVEKMTDDIIDFDETSSQHSADLVTSAKNIFGIGPGSKYAPVKAAIIVDQEDENEEYGVEEFEEEEEKMGSDEIQKIQKHFPA